MFILYICAGFMFGSFINALLWRIYIQDKTHGSTKKLNFNSSIFTGRSVCVHCKHQLSIIDLIPLISWFLVKGKCRYCQKPISKQYPIVELTTATLFFISYLSWPKPIENLEILKFGLWLLILTLLIALFVYDLNWMILPNRLVFTAAIFAIIYAVISLIQLDFFSTATLSLISSVLVASGLFYLIFHISNGKWIGGGDVKLGIVLGLILGSPLNSALMIMIASFAGSFIAGCLLIFKKLTIKTHIPFGPLLIFATFVVLHWGNIIINWYNNLLIPV